MATITATLSVFKKSLQTVLSSSSHYLESTLYLALLDASSPVTEDTTVTGDEFLSDLAGASILSEIPITTPTIANLLLDGDDSAVDELTDVGSGNSADKALLYTKTGSAATSRVWAIGTLSSPISGDDLDDDLQFSSGLIDFDG